MDDKTLEDLLGSTLSDVYERITSTEYNGVSGWLPDWIPAWHCQEFQNTRSRLLGKCSEIQILEWMNAHDANCMAASNGKYVRLAFIPLEVKRDISLLALIRKACLAGENEGLPMLVGDKEAKNLGVAEKVTNGHKHRESHAHKIEFQELIKAYQDNFSTLAELKRFAESKRIDALNDLFKWYDKGHTLRDWVNEVLPGHLKRGAPKKNK